VEQKGFEPARKAGKNLSKIKDTSFQNRSEYGWFRAVCPFEGQSGLREELRAILPNPAAIA
jgi:hypothetical protein